MTTTAEIERALITALDTIRTNWAALVATGSPGSIAGKSATRSLYTHDDDDEREDDLPRADVILNLRRETMLALNGWTRVLVEDRGLTHALPLGTDVPGMVELLRRHAAWMSGHEAGPDAVEELSAWANKINAVANPQRREWTPLGSCPLEIDSPEGPVACGGKVRAYPGHDPRCMKCGTEAVAEWWEREMFPDVDTSVLVNGATLAVLIRRAFGGPLVKEVTLRKWVSRGVIETTGADSKGRTLYNRNHVLKKLSERHAVND